MREAVNAAFARGMHQHRGEIEPFATWLAARRPHHVLEIGTLHGGTALLWSRLATGRIVSVDLPGGVFGGAAHGYHQAKCVARSVELAEIIGDRFRPILGDSRDPRTTEQVVRVLDGELVDLLFIDGDHTLAGVRSDFDQFSPCVRSGGAIAFHDVEDTAFHRDAGCVVSDLWRDLAPQHEHWVFSIGAEWGGIGVLRAA